MVRFSIRFHQRNHKWDLHFWVWSCSCGQNPALVQAKVYVRNEISVPLNCGKTRPTPPTSTLRSPRWQWRGSAMLPWAAGQEAGAGSLKSMLLQFVTRTGPLKNCFRQQTFFSNYMYVKGGSKWDHSLRWLPFSHSRQVANNTKKENGASSRKGILWEKICFSQKGNNPGQENLLAVCWPDVLLLHLYARRLLVN